MSKRRMPCLTFRQRKRILKRLMIPCAAILTLFVYFKFFNHPTYFTYPLEDAYKYAEQLMSGIQPDVGPINGYSYPFIIQNEHKCKSKEGSREAIKLLLMIKSSINNFDQRIAVRNTWGWEQRFTGINIRRVFNLGLTKDIGLMQRIENEQFLYNDIVQSEFVDSYYNNTIKTMMGFRWVMEYCNTLDYVLFIDDDYYVSMKNVFRFVDNPSAYPNDTEYLRTDETYGIEQYELPDPQVYSRNEENPADFFAGFRIHNATPYRKPTNKWYVSYQEYPFASYPWFINAGAMLMSFQTMRKMYYTSFYTAHFRFDDVYVGLLAQKSSVQLLHNENFYNRRIVVPNDIQNVIAAHGYNFSELLSVWWTQFLLQQA